MDTYGSSVHLGPAGIEWNDPLAAFNAADPGTRMERVMEYLSWENYRLHAIITRLLDERFPHA